MTAGNQRPVSSAMAALRPGKAVVRQLWVKEVQMRKPLTPSDIPFYLTLPGAQGFDIQALIDAGLIDITENNAIGDIDNRRVIAVEKDSLSVLELQRKFPGLKVIEGDIFDQLRGASPIVYPTGEQQRIMRSTTINLDLNGPLLYRNSEFPILESVSKLEALHRSPRALDWSLLLTLQGEMTWNEVGQQAAESLLLEKCKEHAKLASGCERLLGNELYSRISNGEY